MSGICIGLALGAIHAVIPADRFTLAWEHTVEKVRWEEDYRRAGGGLELTEARIRGQGAGMEVPEGAVRERGYWRYRPAVPVLPRIRLARADHYTVCWAETCVPLADLVPATQRDAPIEIFPCPPGAKPGLGDQSPAVVLPRARLPLQWPQDPAATPNPPWPTRSS